MSYADRIRLVPPQEPFPHSTLFTVRIWQEQISDDQVEIRGKVQRVLDGEARYFRTWAGLFAILSRSMQESLGSRPQTKADTE